MGAQLISLNPAEGIELPPQIPDGEYTFRLKHHLTAQKFGSPRVELRCVIVDLGEFYGIELSRWYCVDSLKSKAGPRGTFIPKPTGDLLIEFCGLFPDYNPRLERFSLQRLYGIEFIARTRTVKVNNQQTPLPEQLQHSVIAKLVRVA